MTQEVFAYGDMTFAGHRCVAKSCDKSLKGELLTVAEMYDAVARENHISDEGLIPKDEAESYWNEAMKRVRGKMEQETDPDHERYLERALEKAEEVRKEAF
jgi:polyhydroxyalkanoate synthesis regulator phasin